MEVRSLKATSEGSRLQASGVLAIFQNPVAKGKYDLVLDLAQAAAVSRQSQLKAGTLAINGDGSWSTASCSSSGKFGVRDLWWQGSTFSGRDVSAAGKFSLHPQKVALSQLEGQVLRGSFTSQR